MYQQVTLIQSHPLIKIIFLYKCDLHFSMCVSNPIIINVGGVNTTINPSYFDVHIHGLRLVLTQSHVTSLIANLHLGKLEYFTNLSYITFIFIIYLLL